MGPDASGIPQSFDVVASQKEADLMNQQWQDYLTRFQPVANRMIGEAGKGLNTTFLPQNIASDQALTEQAFNNGAQQRDLSRYGQGLSATQSEQMTGLNRLAKSQALANNTNQATLADIDMRNQAVSGGLGSVKVANNPNVTKVAQA
jgi:hypothetical protein